MDVGDNKLTGPIPQCFQKLEGMMGGNSNLYFPGGFEQSLVQVMRGVQVDYTTIMLYVINMDLSSNNLVGEIPENLLLLSGLLGLNLSNNHLTGRIPDRSSISSLTFLSHLNLSNNNLSGRIPTGSQLQTLIDPSIYAGNSELCGSPLLVNCNRDQVPENGGNAQEDEGDDDSEKIWIYSATSGFTTGFLGILGILALKDRWRVALFNFIGGCIGMKL
ncbi:unnamed protein product [Lactuca saligna]|uniref:Uncharacterized protein n=1 Tax=Lactuca saligna TaxID=75948 RepID=A0AA35YHF9_LACSI|nr:unnamed protein product [Lactuca saligna]